jgi:heme exporter protein C
VAAGTGLAALVLGLVIAPPDAVQGQSQRLMYVHVPSAWTAYCAYAVVLVASVAVLLRRGPRWDALARAGAELGVGMTALAIAEGSIWGHTVWGVWWTWDARLVTTAVLMLLYVGYIAVRGLPGTPERSARRSAWLGIALFAAGPVVHFSVLWWRTLHQPPTLLRPDLDPPIAASMLAALLTSLVAFMLAGAWFLRRRVAQLAPVAEPADEPVAAPVEPRATGLDQPAPRPAADATASPLVLTRSRS